MKKDLDKYPLQHVKISDPVIDYDVGTIEFSINVCCTEQINDLIVNTIIGICKEAGITDLYLLDRKFIYEAITEKLERESKMYIDKCKRWKVTNVTITDPHSPIELTLECFMSTEDLGNGISVGDIIKDIEDKLNGTAKTPNINQIVAARADTKSTTALKELLNRIYGKHAYEPITPTGLPKIKEVLFNDPATIIFWADGTKTVVKCEGENFDPEKGMAMAISKKVLGNKYGYYDEFEKWIGKHCRKVMGNKAWNEMKKGKK